jgi:hypothetical protein
MSPTPLRRNSLAQSPAAPRLQTPFLILSLLLVAFWNLSRRPSVAERDAFHTENLRHGFHTADLQAAGENVSESSTHAPPGVKDEIQSLPGVSRERQSLGRSLRGGSSGKPGKVGTEFLAEKGLTGATAFERLRRVQASEEVKLEDR